MVQITKENGMQHAGVPFAWVEVQYPDKTQWDETGFYDMVEQHVAALREQYRDYVRADVFGQNPYFRYFRKFKKTYPVMMQFESVLLKGREFPRWNAVTAVPFLVELETHVLCGTHDIDRLMGSSCIRRKPGNRLRACAAMRSTLTPETSPDATRAASSSA